MKSIIQTTFQVLYHVSCLERGNNRTHSLSKLNAPIDPKDALIQQQKQMIQDLQKQLDCAKKVTNIT